jgi:hypothetical protein
VHQVRRRALAEPVSVAAGAKMKAAWDQVKLRVLFWHGDQPVEGDELQTASGRRYLILSCTEKRITALVLPKDEPVTGRVFRWEWGPRGKGR